MMAVLSGVDLGGRRIIKKKMETNIQVASTMEPSTEKVPFNLKKAGPTKVIL